MNNKIIQFFIFSFVLSSANADLLTMSLRSYNGNGGTSSIFVADNSVLDSDPTLGCVSYSGCIGGISGAFTGFGTTLDGMPSLCFSGELSNAGEAGISGYLFFGDFDDIFAPSPLIRDDISISTTDFLNFTHLSYEGATAGLDFGTSGNRLTRQSSNDGQYYEGVAHGDVSGPISSLSQTINIATGLDSTTSFVATVGSVRVSDFGSTSSLLAFSGLLFWGITKSRKLRE